MRAANKVAGKFGVDWAWRDRVSVSRHRREHCVTVGQRGPRKILAQNWYRLGRGCSL